MNLLLDTHVLVWAESQDDRLGFITRSLLLDPANTLLVSPVSTLELARLISLSRLVFRKPLEDWLATARTNLDFQDALLSHSAAIDSYQLPPNFHRDPADRMLVATARELDCTFVTADDLILTYPHVRTFDART
ncbi:MAG: type II toxin-antitoxin system VapC family toxin [Verrucomicrobiales bacterium]